MPRVPRLRVPRGVSRSWWRATDSTVMCKRDRVCLKVILERTLAIVSHRLERNVWNIAEPEEAVWCGLSTHICVDEVPPPPFPPDHTHRLRHRGTGGLNLVNFKTRKNTDTGNGHHGCTPQPTSWATQVYHSHSPKSNPPSTTPRATASAWAPRQISNSRVDLALPLPRLNIL